jgi:hypothetical protein
MSEQPLTTPIEDTVAKVAGEVAVGEDLRFQRHWWTFERLIWGAFVIVIICDLLGAFGDGWLAEGTASTPDRALTIDYERIERASTPSTMTLHFGPGAIRDGRVKVFVSDSIVQGLGAQRVSPQPAISGIGANGISYTFPATTGPADVQIGLQPTKPGLQDLEVRVPGEPPISTSVFVMP